MENPSTYSSAWRRWLAAAVAIVVMGLVLLVGYSRRDSDKSREVPEAQAPLLRAVPLTLVPGVHLLGGLAPAAAYVIET